MEQKEKRNVAAIIVGFSILVIGILTVIADLCIFSSSGYWAENLGVSLIGSSIVILANCFFVDKVKVNPLDRWGIRNMYGERHDINAESDEMLDSGAKQLDIIAFGLKSFLEDDKRKFSKWLDSGLKIRILTMDPNGNYIAQREDEENEPSGQIKNQIEKLIKWAEDQNKKSKNGKIEVKLYRCMTLDFYWRVDGVIFTGPYLYKKASQRTVTYKFEKGGNGFDLYSEYFEELWRDENMVHRVKGRG